MISRRGSTAGACADRRLVEQGLHGRWWADGRGGVEATLPTTAACRHAHQPSRCALGRRRAALRRWAYPMRELRQDSEIDMDADSTRKPSIPILRQTGGGRSQSRRRRTIRLRSTCRESSSSCRPRVGRRRELYRPGQQLPGFIELSKLVATAEPCSSAARRARPRELPARGPRLAGADTNIGSSTATCFRWRRSRATAAPRHVH